MKYIPAEKLIAEVKALKRRKGFLPFENTEITEAYMARVVQFTCDDIVNLIQSLQQDKEILELCSRIWWEEQGWIMIPPDVTVKGIESLLKQVRKKLQQEQPEVDLEKEIEEQIDIYCNECEKKVTSNVRR